MTRSILRRHGLTVAAMLAAAVALPSAASAAVTRSNVTVPADPSFIHFDGGNPQITVTGTSDGTTADTVDLFCTQGTGTSFRAAKIAAAVPVAADGSFSYSGTTTDARRMACVIRALPAGTVPTATTDLGPFTGPRAFLGEETASRENGAIYDYYVFNAQSQGGMDFDSAGSCGLDDSYVFDPASLARSRPLFFCNAYLYYRDGDPGTRSELQIDGHNAYTPASVYYAIDPRPTTLPALSFSVSLSPITGDMTIDERSPLLFCPADPYPPTAGNCATLQRAPVDLHRVITTDHQGRAVRIVDDFSSRDGAAHAVDLLYEQDFPSGSTGQDPAYRFPWRESTYSQHSLGDTFPGPGGSSPGSIFVKAQKSSPDGDPTWPQGSISYSSPPDAVRFLNYPTTPNAYWALQYRRTVPASGALQLAFVYTDAFLAADVARMAQEAEASLAAATPAGGTPPPGGGSPGGPSGGVPGSRTSFRGVTLRGRRLAVVRGRVALRLACPRRAVRLCRGTATLLSVPQAKRRGRRASATVLGRARFRIAAGHSRRVRVALRRKARSSLRAHRGALSAVLSVLAHDGARRAPTVATTARVRLAAVRRR